MELFKPITSDHDLIELAEKISVHLDDIFESSEITQPLPKKGSFLILMRQPNMDVGHWVCVYDGEYFDSMGGSTDKTWDWKVQPKAVSRYVW